MKKGDTMKLAALFVTLFSILALVSAGGCALKQKKVEEDLAKAGAVNCATAAGDIRVLQAEKAHVAQRVVEGATAIYPASAVLGIVAGIEGTKLRVATGKYNTAIDERIAEIRQKCGTAADAR